MFRGVLLCLVTASLQIANHVKLLNGNTIAPTEDIKLFNLYIFSVAINLSEMQMICCCCFLQSDRNHCANVNANPGGGNNFSYIKVLSIAYVLCSLRLLMLKTDKQKM